MLWNDLLDIFRHPCRHQVPLPILSCLPPVSSQQRRICSAEGPKRNGYLFNFVKECPLSSEASVLSLLTATCRHVFWAISVLGDGHHVTAIKAHAASHRESDILIVLLAVLFIFELPRCSVVQKPPNSYKLITRTRTSLFIPYLITSYFLFSDVVERATTQVAHSIE